MQSTGWPGGRRTAFARRVLRAVAWLVPRSRRGEWRQTWEADLFALASEPTATRRPTIAGFIAGSMPSAFSEFGAEWGWSAVAGDAGRALRHIRGAPLASLFAVLIVIVGVSTNTSIFAVVSATLIRVPPHVADPDTLVQIGRLKADGDFDNFSYPNYADIRDRNQVFSGLAAYGRASTLARTTSGAFPLSVHAVSTSFFDVLGTTPSRGRLFTAREELSRTPVVVISDALWRRDFGASDAAIGHPLVLDGVPFTIIGIAPPAFVGADVAGPAPHAWIPLAACDAALRGRASLNDRGHSWLWVVGRRAPGVSLAQARAAMQVLHATLAREHAGTLGASIAVVPGVGLRPDERSEAERVSTLLMAIVGAVLLIACANLAGLLIAQAARRQRDLTVCAALGASSLRLVRELLFEQLIVACVGAIGAWAVTWWTAAAVQSLLPYELAVTIAPDWRVFVFALAVATVTSLAVAAFPVRRSARVDIVTGLRDGGRGALAGTRSWSVMAAAQLALSFALLIGAGLLLRSVREARTTDPGFEVDTVAAVQVNVELVRRRGEEAAARVSRQLLDLATTLPGVEHAALSSHPPLAAPQRTRTLLVPGSDIGTDRPATVAVNAVSPGYAATLGLELIRGRHFTAGDYERGAPKRAIVSDSAARRLWPADDPVGQHLNTAGDAEVIGVVRDVRLRSLSDRNLSALYVPLSHEPASEMALLVRGSADPRGTAAQLASTIRDALPDVVVGSAGPLRDRLGRTYGETKMVATLLVVFAAIGALLASAGLYVVLASWVAKRGPELAVRAALGATPGQLRRLVFRRALAPAALGLAAGAAVAAVGTRALTALLFGVSRLDPVTYASAAALLLLIALAAGYLPARRAMRADPIVTLKGG